MLVLDVDGVLTDGSMFVSEHGVAFKQYNAKDGMGVRLCQQRNIIVGIISAGTNYELVKRRAEMLDIDRVYVGPRPKLEVLREWLEYIDILPEEIAYIGDDIPDIEVMKYVGVSACPADGAKEVQEIVDIVLTKNGGKGCVREFVTEFL
ncbi:UNVERIFIED_CONTAM: hypothetical protein GTU68_041929 [Idotea baltica]|nr:hypothetical protein [Idotea baltica]